MAERTIEYKLVIDNETGKKTLIDMQGNVVDLDKTMQQFSKNSQESFDKSISKLRDVSLAYDGLKQAISDISGVFSSFVNEAGEAEKSEIKLRTALKARGDATEESFEALSKFASEMENLTVAEGDATIGAMAYALQIGVQKDKLEEVTQGAIGLSRAFGVELNDAIKMVVGGGRGQFEMLGRLNPALKEAADDTQKVAIFQKMLSDGFGYAQTEAKKFDGEIDNLKNRVNNLKESFGFLIRDMLLPFIKFLNNDMVLAGGIAAGTMIALAVPIYSLTTAFTALSAAVTASTGGLNLVIAAIAAAGVGTAAYVVNTKNATEETKAFDNEIKNLKTSLSELTDQEIQKEADRIMNLMSGYDKVLAAKNKQLSEILKAQEKADAEGNQMAFNRLDIERQTMQESINFQLERKKTLGEELKLIDQKQTQDKKSSIKELSEAELKAIEDQKKQADNFEKEQHDKRLKEATSYREKLKAIREQYDADEKAAYEKKILEQSIGNNYTPEMQLADQQIVDEMLLEQKKVFETEVLNIESSTHSARLKAFQEGQISYEKYKQLELAADKKNSTEKTKLRQQENIAAVKDGLQNLQALREFGQTGAGIAKTAAIADTTISTIQGAQKSYTWGATWGGPVGGAIMAAIAYAAGAARVAQITATSTGFQVGGYTGNMPEDQVAGAVHGREFVLNADATKRIGVENLNSLNSGGSITARASQVPSFGFSSTNNDMVSRIEAMNLNMMKQPAPVINITANTDLVKFEMERRDASNKLDKTGFKAEDV